MGRGLDNDDDVENCLNLKFTCLSTGLCGFCCDLLLIFASILLGNSLFVEFQVCVWNGYVIDPLMLHFLWQEIIKELMERLPHMKELMDMYCGPDRVTAKQQMQELDRVAKTLPENIPSSVKRFTDRAVLSLQVFFSNLVHFPFYLIRNYIFGISKKKIF